MSEEKVRKKIVDKCLKKTKFSPLEIEKLLDAYDSTVVIWRTVKQTCRRCLTMLLTHLLIFAAVPAHGPGGGAAPGPRAQLPRVESGQGAGQAAARHGGLAPD